ncbi:MAG: LysR family transcriptional regulator [Actinobacteria bacterium]|nr:LysR family transcriptional regulator [Actinomycetota bacterium]
MAEDLHFSRAAARLNLAQSALSAQVRGLEAEIGGSLLNRSTRHVELTPAGAALLDDARRLLADSDRAVERARALARGETGTLTVASLGPAPGDLLAPIMARFASQHQGVRVELRGFDFDEFVDGVRGRHVDLAFIYLPLDDPEIATLPLVSEQRVVVLPHDHRLARRKRLRPADLAAETFVTQPSSTPQHWRDFWLLVDQIGSRPAISPHVADKLDDWLLLIGQGEGVDTAPAVISRYYPWPEVAFVPLVDAPPATLALAWRHDATNPLILEFAKLARAVATVAAQNPATSYRLPEDD